MTFEEHAARPDAVPSQAQAMPAARLADLEAAINSPAGAPTHDLRELLAETKQARTDADTQYTEADYWRESYRLAKGLTNDEIGAARDASKAHPRPCGFPHETCACDD